MFTPLRQFMTQNSNYKWPKVLVQLFFRSGKLTLNGSVNGSVVIYSKIQDKLSRVP